MDGGYEEGYKNCSCFWGREPGSLLKVLDNYVSDFQNLRVLDPGCGEGKNSIYFAHRGASVRAFDISRKAIENAKKAWPDEKNIHWEIADVERVEFLKEDHDIVVSYGLFHCLRSQDKISEIIKKLKWTTKKGGYQIVCAFNDRFQDLSAHPGFTPTLLNHDFYLGAFSDWEVINVSDSDLEETHPHNNLKHKHSLTRLIARKSK